MSCVFKGENTEERLPTPHSVPFGCFLWPAGNTVVVFLHHYIKSDTQGKKIINTMTNLYLYLLKSPRKGSSQGKVISVWGRHYSLLPSALFPWERIQEGFPRPSFCPCGERGGNILSYLYLHTRLLALILSVGKRVNNFSCMLPICLGECQIH